MPFGATVGNERIVAAFEQNEDFTGALMHGYTYSGHAAACAAGASPSRVMSAFAPRSSR